MPGEALLIEGALEILVATFRYRLWKRHRLFPLLVHRRNDVMRVSFSALVRLHDDDGNFVFVHNLHRPGTFGPFGGVYKYRRRAEKTLASFEFRGEDLGPHREMQSDLRGYVLRKKFLAFLHWFEKGEERESAESCLRRELREELQEIGSKIRVPDDLHFTHLHTVLEGPTNLRNQNAKQVRIFDVFDVDGPSAAQRFFARLIKLAGNHEHLALANAEQIRNGRGSKNEMLGHHCCYVIQKKSTFTEDPGMIDLREHK